MVRDNANLAVGSQPVIRWTADGGTQQQRNMTKIG